MSIRYVPTEQIDEPTTPLKPRIPDPLLEYHSSHGDISDYEKDELFKEDGQQILILEAQAIAEQNRTLIEVFEALQDTVMLPLELKVLASRQYEINDEATKSFLEAAKNPDLKTGLLSPEYLRDFAASRAGMPIEKGWRNAFIMGSNQNENPALYMQTTDLIEAPGPAQVTTEALINEIGIEIRRALHTQSLSMGLVTQSQQSPDRHNAIRQVLQVWGHSPKGVEKPIPNGDGSKIVVPRKFLKGILPENKGTLTIPHITSEKEIGTFLQEFSRKIGLVLSQSTQPMNVKQNLRRQNPLYLFHRPVHPIYTDPHPMYDREI